MVQNTWILVCDASRARLLVEQGRRRDISLLESFEHADSRAHGRDLTTEAPGRKPVGPVPAARVGGQGGAYGRPGAEPDTDPKDIEAQKFARELAARLDKGRSDHAYERLVIAAPPRFLGMLRGTLDDEVTKMIEV